MKNATFTDKELRGFYDICESMEASGNGGWYTSHFSRDTGYIFFTGRNHLAYRQGVIFYSTGWGWRLRKNWRETFGERFFEFVKDWKDAYFISQPKRQTKLQMIVTRMQARRFAEGESKDAETTDFSEIELVNASAMDELISLLPRAKFVGMNEQVEENYKFVLDAREKIGKGKIE